LEKWHQETEKMEKLAASKDSDLAIYYLAISLTIVLKYDFNVEIVCVTGCREL
jgi:hypothetical protein